MNAYAIPGIMRPPNTVESIIRTVCNHFDLTPELIKLRSRKKEVTLTRQYCMYFMKLKTDITLTTISKQFGANYYDHSAVIHSINKIKDFLSINDEITIRNIEAINKRLIRNK